MTGRHEWIRSFVALLLEVERGQRPARHLRPLVHSDLFPTLAASADSDARLVHVRKIRLQHGEQSCEAAVLLDVWDRTRGRRVEALAVSLRRLDGRWRVVQVDRPGRVQRACSAESVESNLTPVCSELLCTERSPAWQLPDGWRQPARAA